MSCEDARLLLNARYTSPANGGPRGIGEKWVVIQEARAGGTWRGNYGQCDYLAIGSWASTRNVLIGHEIKNSYGDWRNEIAKPEKSDRFRRYCHEWWLVAPPKVVERAADEADPALWGLMAFTEKRLWVVRPSPRLTPRPVPWEWAVAWMTHIQRSYERRRVTADWTHEDAG